jgi:membrane protein DedA with SNARE-associated domain
MSLVTIATKLINDSGYTGLAAGLIINGIGIPIPSELILGLAGLGVKVGSFALVPTLIVATIAQVIGLTIAYGIARFGGVALIERYGKYVLIRKQEVAAAETWFERYGGRLVLFGLLMPALHGYVGYPAGLARMRIERFLIFAAIGSFLWALILGGLGYFLGGHLDSIDSVLHRFGLVVVALLVIAAAWLIRRHWRKHDATPNDLS